MQMTEAMELQRQWGNKHCDHPRVVKEYHLGTQTGDRVCTQCGTSASPEYFRKGKPVPMAGLVHDCPQCGGSRTMTKLINDGLHHCGSCGYKKEFQL